MKKKFTLLLSVIMIMSLCFCMTACGGGSSDPAPADDTEKAVEEVTLESYCAEHAEVMDFITQGDTENENDVYSLRTTVDGNAIVATYTLLGVLGDDDLKTIHDEYENNPQFQDAANKILNDVHAIALEEISIEDMSYKLVTVNGDGNEFWSKEYFIAE